MTYIETEQLLAQAQRRWLVTGAAGFIGSHLVERLLKLGQTVVGFDNLATGHRRNLDDVLAAVPGSEGRFTFLEQDIRDADACQAACSGVDVVLHQAALGSVPRSLADPATTHAVNVDGFVNIILAAKEEGVGRFVYASSSSVYGDDPRLPKAEGNEGQPLSPYALSKLVGEWYADVYQRVYGLEAIGLRYFNVFGPRQDPAGPYAAVIPRWIDRLMRGEPCEVFGDGETSRDFCYVENVVQANLLAAMAPVDATGAVYNIAYGERTTLNQLFELLRQLVAAHEPAAVTVPNVHLDPRPGDVRHSLAEVRLAREHLGYRPVIDVRRGIEDTVAAALGRPTAGTA